MSVDSVIELKNQVVASMRENKYQDAFILLQKLEGFDPANSEYRSLMNVVRQKISSNSTVVSQSISSATIAPSVNPANDTVAQRQQYQQLSPEEWHNAMLKNETIERCARKVKENDMPEWINVPMRYSRPGDTVIELGSGQGVLSGMLAYKQRHTVLVDFSQQSLNFSRAMYEALNLQGKFHLADITKPLPIDSSSADVVWSSGVLEHFSDDKIVAILKESARISRKYIISIVPNANSIFYRIGKWKQEHEGTWKYGYEDPKYSMAGLFKRAGISNVHEYTIAPFHSINFLRDARLNEWAELVKRFFENVRPGELYRLNQGYLLVTVGTRRPLKKLAVVPTDPIAAYERSGIANWLEDYYNPTGLFDEVYCLSPSETQERFAYGMHLIPTPEKDFSRLVNELDIDVVRGYGGYSTCDFVCNNKIENIPVVVSVHDTNPQLLRPSIVQADYVLAVSQAVKKMCMDKGVAENKIHLLYNRVDFSIFYPRDNKQEREAFRAQYPGQYLILHVGRKVEQKNLDTVIRALRLLGEDYHCLFIGAGDVQPFKNLAHQENVLSQCTFIPVVPNEQLPVYYSYTDVMCTPSRWEGFGIIFIEALACSAIAITSNIAPMSEYIKNFENGILVDKYEDPVALADAIRIGCMNEKIRNHIRSNCRNSVASYNKEIIDQKEAEFYSNVLSNRNHNELADEQYDCGCNDSVTDQIIHGNKWYLNDQFSWANQPSMRWVFNRRYEFIRNIIEQSQQRLHRTVSLLDIGCGDGYWLSRLNGLPNVKLYGMDYNHIRVDRARKALPDVEIYHSDIFTYSPHRTFDLVLLSQVIEHVDDDRALLQKVRGFLNSDGVLILGTPNEGSPAHELQRKKLGASFQTDHVHFYTEPEIRSKIKQAGFVIEDIFREVYYVGDDEKYYWILSQQWGGPLLTFLTSLDPSGCSDYYFSCRRTANNLADSDADDSLPVPNIVDVKKGIAELEKVLLRNKKESLHE